LTPQSADEGEAGATSLSALQQRIRIEELLFGYCSLVDLLDIDGVVGLFTEDGVFDYGFGRVFKGREELRQLFSRLALYEATSHHLSNVRITVGADLTARAESVLYAYHVRSEGSEEIRLWARYSDFLVLDGGHWRFQRRQLRAAAEKGTSPPAHLDTQYERIDRKRPIS